MHVATAGHVVALDDSDADKFVVVCAFTLDKLKMDTTMHTTTKWPNVLRLCMAKKSHR